VTRPSLLPVVLLALLASSCDLFNPHATTRYAMTANALDVFARNDTLLVAAGDGGLFAFDISKPKAPRRLFNAVFVHRDCRSVIAAGGAAYVGTDSSVVAYDFATGTQTRLYAGGASQVVTGLVADADRLYVATTAGVTVFSFASPHPLRFVPLAGEPTGLARHDSRLFVSLNDWGVCILNILAGDSLVLDGLRLGLQCRAEGVTVSPSGYCIISQADSGFVVLLTPTPDSMLDLAAGGSSGPTKATAAVDGVQDVTFYSADSSTVTINRVVNGPNQHSTSAEVDFAEFAGFTRRICIGSNGYVYTASGDAGVYIIREK
jgi:hypothetical protein